MSDFRLPFKHRLNGLNGRLGQQCSVHLSACGCGPSPYFCVDMVVVRVPRTVNRIDRSLSLFAS
jgi:hypothetical protein